MTFLIDTGSQRSFISHREYEDQLRLQLTKTNTPIRMFGMGGSELNIRGKVTVPVHIGTEVVMHDFLIADIEEEAILGYDFMKKHQVEWNWKGQTLNIAQTSIPCNMEHQHIPHRIARISTKGPVIIPPRSEVIVTGIVYK